MPAVQVLHLKRHCRWTESTQNFTRCGWVVYVLWDSVYCMRLRELRAATWTNKAMVHRILLPGTHWTKDFSSLGARRRRGHRASDATQQRCYGPYYTHCCDAIAVVSRRHRAHCRKIWRRPQKQEYVTYYNIDSSKSSHGHRQHCVENVVKFCDSWDMDATDREWETDTLITVLRTTAVAE